jgi:uncharacterized protein involved in exopolysaccharide biosynthesis/Mrp family chromosome partitioning ATPase
MTNTRLSEQRTGRAEDSLRDAPLSISEMMAIFSRRRWTLILSVAVLTFFVLGVGALMTPLYRATARVALLPHQDLGLRDMAILPASSADDLAIDTHVQLISSAEYLREVVRRLDLMKDQQFLRATTESRGFRRLAQGLWSVLGESPTERASLTGQDITIDGIVAELVDGLIVSRVSRSSVIDISYDFFDPEYAAEIPNTLATVYVDKQQERKTSAIAKTIEWLDRRLLELRGDILTAELRIETYKDSHSLVLSDVASLDDSQFIELNNQLIEVRSQAAAAEAQLSMVASTASRPGALDVLSKMIDTPTMAILWEQQLELRRKEAELSETLGDRHPAMADIRSQQRALQSKLEREIEVTRSKMKSDLALLEQKEKAITAQIAAVRQRSSGNQIALVELEDMQRNATASRMLFEQILARRKEAQEQSDLLQADADVVTYASPPTRPETFPLPLLGVLGLITSGVVGALVALVRDSADKSVRAAIQVEQVANVDCLSLIPRIRLPRQQTIPRYITDQPLSDYSEAVRTLASEMSLRLARDGEPGQDGRVVLLTSSIPGEGKSSISVAFALHMALSGIAVILVDLDLRHSSIAPTLGRSRRKGPGLEDVLCGKAKLHNAIRTFAVAGADTGFRGTGRAPSPVFDYLVPRSRSPAAPLNWSSVSNMLHTLRNNYGLVVVDSPPCLGVGDALVLGAIADYTLFVVRWGRTAAAQVVGALDFLSQRGAKIIGFVLNSIDTSAYDGYAVSYGDCRGGYRYYRKYYTKRGWLTETECQRGEERSIMAQNVEPHR